MKKIHPLFIFSFFIALIIASLVRPLLCQAKTDLSFTTNQISKALNEEFPIEIKIVSSNTIIGTDLKILFDPAAIAITKASPGTFWINPQIIKQSIDQQKGVVGLSIFSLTTQPEGTFATFSAKLINNQNPKTIIKIDPDSILAGLGGQKITYTNSSLTVFLPGPTAVPTLQPTTVPSLNSNPTVTSSETKPTITLVDQSTPTPPAVDKTAASSLRYIALILLVLGITALVVLKKTG